MEKSLRLCAVLFICLSTLTSSVHVTAQTQTGLPIQAPSQNSQQTSSRINTLPLYAQNIAAGNSPSPSPAQNASRASPKPPVVAPAPEPEVEPPKIVPTPEVNPVAAPVSQSSLARQLDQFLLPPVPPQAQPQVAAIRAAVQASVGNANGFATSVLNAKDVGGVLTVAVAFSDLIANQHAETLLRLSASASAFGYNNIASYVNQAFGRAVSDQIARGDVKNAATAIAAAFTLAGGIGPSLSTSQALGSIVTSVGCTAPLSTALVTATQQVVGQTGQSPHSGLGNTFAYSVAQNPALSGCWTAVAGNTAQQLLASIQPVSIVGQQSTAPTGSINPQSTGFPPNVRSNSG